MVFEDDGSIAGRPAFSFSYHGLAFLLPKFLKQLLT